MKLSNRVFLPLIVGTGVLVALVLGAWYANVRARTNLTDADRIRVPISRAPVRQILWQPAQPVPGQEEAADQYEPRISADGTMLIFVRGRAGANADLYMSRWTADGWSKAESLATVNSGADELGPALSQDGASLYFYSDRSGGLGGFDIWVSRATDSSWGEPVNLGPAVNTDFNEYGPAPTPIGSRLYFSSNRPRPGEPAVQRDAWPATIREQRTRHDYDLYFIDLGPSGPTAAAPVTELNTSADEGAPAISPAGDFLYFASNRSGGMGGFDIYRSRFFRGHHQLAEGLGAAINSPFNDMDPALSMDGFRFHFSTDRPVHAAGGETNAPVPSAASGTQAPAHYSLWTSSSREVFSEVEPARTADLISRIWAATWPWLLLLLLASLAALLFLLALRDAVLRRRLRQLSLMAKCVLVSLVIHAVILSLLGVWRVGNAIGEILRPPGGTRVMLGSVGAGGLAAQVRAAAATMSIEAPSVQSSRASLAVPALEVPVLSLALLPAPIPSAPTVPTPAAEEAHPEHSVLVSTVASPDPRSQAPQTLLPASQAPAPVNAEASRQSLAAPAAPTPVRAPTTNAAPGSAQVSLQPSRSELPEVSATALEMAGIESAPSGTVRPTSGVPSDIAAAALPNAGTPKESARLPAMTERSAADGASAAVSAASQSPRAEFVAGTPGAAPNFSLLPAPRAVPAANVALTSLPVSEAAPETLVPRMVGQSMPNSAPGVGAAVRIPLEENRDAPQAAPSRDAGSRAIASLPVSSRASLGVGSPDIQSRITVPAVPSAIPTVGAPPIALPATEASTGQGPARLATASPQAPATDAAVGIRLPEDAHQSAAASESTSDAAPNAAGTDRVASGPRPNILGPSGAAPTVHLNPAAVGVSPRLPSADLPGAGIDSTPREDNARGLAPTSSAIPAAARELSTRLPALGEPVRPPVETFAQRAPEVRAELLERTGGSHETEQAVALALEWFRAHQDPDGHWSGRHYDDQCGQCAGQAEIDFDAATTGMAVLCYLSAGHTHAADGPYRDAVRRALAWLIDRQDASGDLRRGETMYSQTIAAVALCEAASMTRDPWLQGPARSAVTFVARGPSAQGRRDARSAAADTSVLGWQVMAMKSAERCGFNMPRTTFDSARRWLDQVASPGAPGRYAYRPGEAPSAAATAEAMFVQQLLGHTREEPRMRESAQFILATPPAWRNVAPTYYWYYATLALFQQQDEPWRQWNEGITRELLVNQRRDGPAAGSWDPQDEWSRLGGRIYQTAVCTLSLEIYYRYRVAGPGSAR